MSSTPRLRQEAVERHVRADADLRRMLLQLAVQRVFADEIEVRVDLLANDRQRVDQQPLVLDAAEAGDLNDPEGVRRRRVVLAA